MISSVFGTIRLVHVGAYPFLRMRDSQKKDAVTVTPRLFPEVPAVSFVIGEVPKRAYVGCRTSGGLVHSPVSGKWVSSNDSGVRNSRHREIELMPRLDRFLTGPIQVKFRSR